MSDCDAEARGCADSQIAREFRFSQLKPRQAIIACPYTMAGMSALVSELVEIPQRIKSSRGVFLVRCSLWFM